MISTPILVILTIYAIWITVITILLSRMINRYYTLTKNIKKRELRELLEHARDKLNNQQKSIDALEKWIKKLENDEKSHIQKVGFIRFNPFTDTGGNQSFCLSLLDGNEDGVVISSLHSREQTRIYAKAIAKGKTEGFELSNEEKRSIDQAKTVNK
jgi:hypothetical protein